MSQIVKYKANDGVEVQLSPATVQAYIATGNAQADTRDVVRFIMTCKEQDIKFVGMGDTIEIWSCQQAEKNQMNPEDFGETLEELMVEMKNE